MTVPQVPAPLPQVAPPPLSQYMGEPQPYNLPAYGARLEGVNTIPDNESIANVFCFGAFVNKISGVVYNDITRNFPFMSIDGSICFFVLYNYELNAILVKAIANVDDHSIYEAYKEVFETLEAKGFKPKMNVMDNLAKKSSRSYSPKRNTICTWWNHTITA